MKRNAPRSPCWSALWTVAALLASTGQAGSWMSLSDQTILGPEVKMREQVQALTAQACKPAVRDPTTPGLAPVLPGGLNIDEAIRTLEKTLGALQPGDAAREGLERALKMLREQKAGGVKVLPLPVRREAGAMSFEAALKAAQALVGSAGRNAPAATSNDVAAALSARSTRAVVALLLARQNAAPNDSMTLVNLAGALSLAGLAREAIAVLDRADELGGVPPSPGGVPGRAIALSNRGHAFLGLGRWAEAQRPLREALALAPEFSEARMNLSKALLCAGDVAGATRELRVALRRTVAPEGSDLVVTEDTPGTHGDALKPREQASTRRAARDLFDLSRGASFTLPQLKLPADRQQAAVLKKQYEALEREGRAITEGLLGRSTALNVSTLLDPGEQRWYRLVLNAIDTSNFEPEVWPAYQAAYRAHDDLHKAFPLAARTRREAIEAVKGSTCATRKSGFDAADRAFRDTMRPWLKAHEQAMTQYVAANVQLQSALAANLPDPQVRAAVRAGIEARGKSMFYGPVVGAAIMFSDAWTVDLTCDAPLPDVILDLGALPELSADPCGGALSSAKLKSKVPSAALKGAGLGLSWSLSCKKLDIELSTSSLLGTDWLGGFASASLDWNGNATLFTGVKAELKLPKTVPATGSVGAKEGLYVKFGPDGIQDAGMRVELKAALGAGPDAGTGLWEGKIEQEFGLAAAAAYWRER